MFKKISGDWLSPCDVLVSPLSPPGQGFQTWLPWETRQQLIPVVSPLNTGFVEVNFHRQRPGLLTFLWLFHGDCDHRTQVVRVDFLGIIQELFISVDAQLKRHRKKKNMKKTPGSLTLSHPTWSRLLHSDLAACKYEVRHIATCVQNSVAK